MDWNLLLFAARWVMIALIYLVLGLLLVSVYREGTARQVIQKEKQTKVLGRLRVANPGSDAHLTAGTVVQLDRLTSLGSSPDNDIILSDMFVSGHHFQLRWDGRKWWLEDLGSKNGTWVGGHLLTPGQPVVVQPGASITAGDMLLELMD